MRPLDRALVGVVIVLLVLQLLGGRLPAPSVLPAAQAQQQPRPVYDGALTTGRTLVTVSPEGDTIYVWVCTLVNAVPTFTVQRHTASR
jgi:hypothetical protein